MEWFSFDDETNDVEQYDEHLSGIENKFLSNPESLIGKNISPRRVIEIINETKLLNKQLQDYFE